MMDVRDRSAVLTLVHETVPAVIIHTAALNPGQGSDFMGVNVDGTMHVAEAAERVNAQLIHISSDLVFDGQKGGYGEEDSPAPITRYGRSKALAEDAVIDSGARFVIVRTSLMYGSAAAARNTSGRIPRWKTWDRQTRWVIGDLTAGRPVHLFTDEIRCPIWVETLTAAIVELAERSLARPLEFDVLHVAGGQALSRYAFGVRLARFHGVDPSHITPALSMTSGLNRPLDCTLDSSLAASLLRTELRGVDQVLQNI